MPASFFYFGNITDNPMRKLAFRRKISRNDKKETESLTAADAHFMI